MGVGMMLKGGGHVPPSSKYEIHSLERANFHSVSAFSWEVNHLHLTRTNQDQPDTRFARDVGGGNYI